MPICGLDVHKREVEAVLLDDEGRVVGRERFACTREGLGSFARRHLTFAHRVALEATTHTWAIVAELESHCGEVVVSNPLRTRAIAEAKIKTDEIDALVLAQLLRADFLPRVWRPDADTRRRRHLTSRRAALVADRTRIKNRIHALLHQALIPVPVKDLFGTGGLSWLEKYDFDPITRQGIDAERRLLTGVEQEIAALGKLLAEDAVHDKRIKLLMTLPGVDVAIAQTLLGALGDVTRFKDGERAASYLGLVPATYQSGDHAYHGRITKQGRGHARWMLVQAAQHLDRHPGPLGVFFRRLRQKKNRNVAVVATARKLVVIAWHMLKHNQPYRYAEPRTTEAKLARLRRATGSPRRRGGIAPGTARSKAYGTGQGTRAIPALDRIYQSEDIAALEPPAPGEIRMCDDLGVKPYVDDIHRERRTPKRLRLKPLS